MSPEDAHAGRGRAMHEGGRERALISPTDWPALLRLVEQALELPLAQRPGWLERQSLPYPTRAALAHLLEQRAALEQAEFLATLPPLGLGSSSDPRQLSSPFAAGALVGPWWLLRRLGEGGMSVVWLARRADGSLDRDVALKLPHAGPGQDMLARRMLRERRILAALEHPHIARLYDVGFSETGSPYLVMEYVGGQDLLVYADAKKLTPGERVALFQQVLSAVQHAHARLVLHRDLKPSNVLVDSAGQVKLLDFGIATMILGDGEQPLHTDITRAAGRPLTPAYASPEQQRGEPLSTASDVYSLGVVLHELLSGTKPGDVTGAASARPLRGDLRLIVLKALAEEPARRYASAEAFAADLRCWQQGLPVAARAPSAWYSATRFVRRHTLAVALVATGVALLAGAGSVAALQAVAARKQGERAAVARDFLLQLLTESAPDRMGGARLNVNELLRRGQAKAGQSLSGQPRLQAELLSGLGMAQLQSNDLLAADAAFGQAAQLFHALDDPANEVSVRLARLELVLQDHRFEDYSARLAELTPLRATIQADPRLHARWKLAAGKGAASQTGNYGLALLQRAAAEADPSDALQAAVAFEAHLTLAQAHGSGQRFVQAYQALEAATAVASLAGSAGRSGRDVAFQHAMAQVYAHQGRYAELARWLPSRIEHCEAAFGQGSRRCGELQQMRLWTLLRTGDMDQAMAQAGKLVPMLEQSSARHARFMSAYLLTQIAAASGRGDAVYNAVANLRAMTSPDAPDALTPRHRVPALGILALEALRAGRLDEAEQLVARADTAVRHTTDQDLRPEASTLDFPRALALQARGRHAAALKTFGTRCDADPAASLLIRMQSLNCARSLVATGQRGRAAVLVRHALAQMKADLGADAPNVRRAEQLLAELQARRPPAAVVWSGRQIFISGVR